MHVDIIDRFEELELLRGDWEAVSETDPEAQIFTSWAWMSGWLRRLSTQWIVLAAKETATSAHYSGFLPLQLLTIRGRDGRLYNDLKLAGGMLAGYNGYICDPRLESAITKAFCATITELRWTKLHLENVFLSPRRLELFLSHFPASQFSKGKVQRIDDGDGIDHDIYVYVELPGDWELFLGERLGAATRKTARRTLRQIDDESEYRVTHVTAQSLEHDLDVLLGLWEIQWAEKLTARYNAQLPRVMINNFRRMLTWCFNQEVLFLPVLWQDDKPIGVQGSLIDRKNRALVGLLNGRDLSVRKPAPGFSLHLFSVRWAIENGFRVYDLQTGDFSYKYDFGGLERRVECIAVTTRDRRNLGGALEPRSVRAAFAYSRSAHADGKFAEAAIGCHQILSIDPDHGGARQLLEAIGTGLDTDLNHGLRLAAGLMEKGRAADAEVIYRRVLAAEPRHFDAVNLLGVLLLQREDFQAADEQFALAIELRPDEAGPYYCRGLAQLKLKHLGEALRNFEIAAALRPDDVKAAAIRDKLLGMAPSGARRVGIHQPATTAN